MSVAPFIDFTYDNEEAWDDFMLVNGLSHARYNAVIEDSGFTVPTANLFDLDDSENGRSDWLRNHYQQHQYLAVLIGMTGLADLSDVELNDNAQFDNWLQLHAQAHQVLDVALLI